MEENSTSIHDVPLTLDNILKDCWQRLTQGVASSKHAFHSPTLGTINNGVPELRTVVLRGVIPSEQILIFHTDYRSPKISQIQQNNIVSWLFYDEKKRIQLRIRAKAFIHNQDQKSLESWKKSRLESRMCYLTTIAPSAILDELEDVNQETLDIKTLTEEILAPGYANFVKIETKVIEIDWLFLKHNGHKRAKFIYDDEAAGLRKYWLNP